MLVGLYIFVDDDYGDPIYGDPPSTEVDEGLWERACELVGDALDGEGDPRGVVAHAGHQIGWRTLVKTGLSFVVIVTKEVRSPHVEAYLRQLGNRYFQEVEDVREPDRGGIQDVLVDVVPPWERDYGEDA